MSSGGETLWCLKEIKQFRLQLLEARSFLLLVFPAVAHQFVNSVGATLEDYLNKLFFNINIVESALSLEVATGGEKGISLESEKSLSRLSTISSLRRCGQNLTFLKITSPLSS